MPGPLPSSDLDPGTGKRQLNLEAEAESTGREGEGKPQEENLPTLKEEPRSFESQTDNSLDHSQWS